MLIILIIIGIMIGLFLLYSIIPTFFIRTFRLGVVQHGKWPKKVALTFDDGPHPIYTPALLDLFKAFEVKATFFVVGENALANPEILIRMKNEGHDIGIHHYQHKSNWFLTPARVKQQCQKTADAIESIVGEAPVYYRPPWGHLNAFIHFSSRPFKIVMWSAILGDWKLALGKERLVSRLQKTVKDGAIIVLHDRGDNPGADPEAPAITIEALREYLEKDRKDYEFVTLSSLLQAK